MSLRRLSPAIKSFFRWIVVLACSLAAGCAEPERPSGRDCEQNVRTAGILCAHRSARRALSGKTPVIGPAGSIITDPSFGSRIYASPMADQTEPRLSAHSTLPLPRNRIRGTKTPTMFYVVTSGGSFLLYDFNPATMTARAVNTPNLTWGAEPQFSFRQPTSSIASIAEQRPFEAVRPHRAGE